MLFMPSKHILSYWWKLQNAVKDSKRYNTQAFHASDIRLGEEAYINWN